MPNAEQAYPLCAIFRLGFVSNLPTTSFFPEVRIKFDKWAIDVVRTYMFS